MAGIKIIDECGFDGIFAIPSYFGGEFLKSCSAEECRDIEMSPGMVDSPAELQYSEDM